VGGATGDTDGTGVGGKLGDREVSGVGCHNRTSGCDGL
jgi:hypothetical protein